MSFEHNFIHGYECEFENDFEDEDVQAFPETIISDSYQSSDYVDFLMCHDALSLGQLDQGNQFFECQSDLPSHSYHESIQTPMTSEDLPSSGTQTCFEDLCISYNQAENQQNFRATLEKFLYENEFPESLSSSPSSFIELDRDPTELDRQLKNIDENSFELRLINVPAVVQVPLELEHQILEKGQIEEDMHSLVDGSFEIPPLKEIEIFSQRKKSAKRNEGKKPNSRQSQYKNIYSLVEEHSRRLLKDWIDLSWEEIEKVENGHKNVAAQIEEEMELKFDFEQFENNIQESDELKKSRNLPICQKFNEKLDSQIKKKRQKELAQKLHYKRFRLLSSLSRLVNNNPDAFITRTEFEECLEKKPKTRTLACMKDFLKENIKFGLIVSRLSVELLPISMESQESNLLRKSALAFMYWKVKSPMQQKNRELLRREDTRAHIRGVLKDVYLELKEGAQFLLPARELQMVEDCFNDSDDLGNNSEKQFCLDFELSRDVSSYINEHNQCFDEFLRDEDLLKKRTKRYQS